MKSIEVALVLFFRTCLTNNVQNTRVQIARQHGAYLLLDILHSPLENTSRQVDLTTSNEEEKIIYQYVTKSIYR